jgi:hypothetical protein
VTCRTALPRRKNACHPPHRLPRDPGAPTRSGFSAGFRRFKFKVGIDRDQDFANLRAVSTLPGEDEGLMIDVNPNLLRPMPAAAGAHVRQSAINEYRYI